jgi:hypothetical protein
MVAMIRRGGWDSNERSCHRWGSVQSKTVATRAAKHKASIEVANRQRVSTIEGRSRTAWTAACRGDHAGLAGTTRPLAVSSTMSSSDFQTGQYQSALRRNRRISSSSHSRRAHTLG